MIKAPPEQTVHAKSPKLTRSYSIPKLNTSSIVRQVIKAEVLKTLRTVRSEAQLNVKDLIRLRKQGRFRADSREVYP